MTFSWIDTFTGFTIGFFTGMTYGIMIIYIWLKLKEHS